MNIAIAQQKIKRIMKDNCYRRRTLTTSGRIEFNRMPFYRTSRHLFSRESERQGKEYHVELLLDYSGSMANQGLIGLACQATEMIAKTLGRYCNLTITLFNYLEKTVPWQEFKAREFEHIPDDDNTALVRDDNGRAQLVPVQTAIHYKERDQQTYTGLAGNWEICNLENAAQRLQRKKGNKIILILLDGVPNLDDFQGQNPPPQLFVAGRPCGKRDDYKKRVLKISQDITVLAYGIGTSGPAQFYPNFHQIDEAEDILPTLITSLSQHITK